MMQIGVLIPALNPDDNLIKLTQALMTIRTPLAALIVVDDGSDVAHQAIFTRLMQFADPRIHILHHSHNRGKGAALKTGFNYCCQYFPALAGVATMDADGQHTVPALQACLTRFSAQPTALVLGVRQFTKKVPWRSQFGNRLTSQLVRAFTHQHISDTQTGLRVIPISYVQQLRDFPGDHFEFEFDMLLEARQSAIEIIEQPIPTIYFAGNRSSHFRVIHDSLAIYARFLKFAASSLASFLIDIGLFSAVLILLGNHVLNSILIATLVSRLLSAIANYLINHHLVFDHAGHRTLLKYGSLFLVQLLASGYLTGFLTQLLPASSGTVTPVLAKIIVDFTLFIISYQIQRDFIFKEGAHV
ncbi:glycosyl transferase [Lactobacillus sp. CBA3606]|uniref:bifunctional glycosyltransferase family 2/GtrA family protein n=1 Tax=Lactobacillus sp. CBA3606 TaxID=2099789 RepID=UPI000CFC594A|nr:bifunctional glycosyltransferase family 2/GtrA family protein [Lactobacillus sp. CBA3606]AVK63759.1 glycosyl transferase [Lactobacillus sp. CBA3606]